MREMRMTEWLIFLAKQCLELPPTSPMKLSIISKLLDNYCT